MAVRYAALTYVWGVTTTFRGIIGSLDVLVLTSWVRVTSGIYWLAMSVRCLVAPETSSSVSAGISTSGRNSFSGPNSTSGSTFISRPPSLVTWWPWRRTVLHRDGSRRRRVSLRLPGPPELYPTCRIGRCNLRYGLDLGPFLEPAIIDELLRKFTQPAEARKWLFTVTASLKPTEILGGNVEFNCGNFMVESTE